MAEAMGLTLGGLSAGAVYAQLKLDDSPFYASLTRANTALRVAQESMEARFGRINGLLGGLSRNLVIAGAAGAAGLGLAVKTAGDFDTAMRYVNSISRLSQGELRGLALEVRNLSKEIGSKGPAELARGLYDVASSGFYGAEGLQVIRTAAYQAVAGMTDTATAVRATTGVLNAYGKGADEANDISDILFATVDKGVITYGELAQNIGEVVATASGAKVEFGEVGAAIATMTKGGIVPPEAVTSLNRFLIMLLEGGKQLTPLIKQYGYESGSALLEARGLAGAVDMISKATGGNADALRQLFPEMRAFRAALSLARQEGAAFRQDLANIADPAARAGSTMSAFGEITQSAGYKFDKARTAIERAGVTIGSKLLPGAAMVAEVMGDIAEAADQVNPVLLAYATAAALVVAASAKVAQWTVQVVNAVQTETAVRVLHAKQVAADTASVLEYAVAQETVTAAELRGAAAAEAQATAWAEMVVAEEGVTSALAKEALAQQAAARARLEGAQAARAEATAMLADAQAANAAKVGFWGAASLATKLTVIGTIIAAAIAVLVPLYNWLKKTSSAEAELAEQTDQAIKEQQQQIDTLQKLVDGQRAEARHARALVDEYESLAKKERKTQTDKEKLKRLTGELNAEFNILRKELGLQPGQWDGATKSIVSYADALQKATDNERKLFGYKVHLEALSARQAREKAVSGLLAATPSKEVSTAVYERVGRASSAVPAGRSGGQAGPVVRVLTAAERYAAAVKYWERRARSDDQKTADQAKRKLDELRSAFQAETVAQERQRAFERGEYIPKPTSTGEGDGSGRSLPGGAGSQTAAEKLRANFEQQFLRARNMLAAGQAQRGMALMRQLALGISMQTIPALQAGMVKGVTPPEVPELESYLRERLREVQELTQGTADRAVQWAKEMADLAEGRADLRQQQRSAEAALTDAVSDDLAALLAEKATQEQRVKRARETAAWARTQAQPYLEQTAEIAALRERQRRGELSSQQIGHLQRLQDLLNPETPSGMAASRALEQYREAEGALQMAERQLTSLAEALPERVQSLAGDLQRLYDEQHTTYRGALAALDNYVKRLQEAGLYDVLAARVVEGVRREMADTEAERARKLADTALAPELERRQELLALERDRLAAMVTGADGVVRTEQEIADQRRLVADAILAEADAERTLLEYRQKAGQVTDLQAIAEEERRLSALRLQVLFGNLSPDELAAQRQRIADMQEAYLERFMTPGSQQPWRVRLEESGDLQEQIAEQWRGFGQVLWDGARDRGSIHRYFQEALEEALRTRWEKLWERLGEKGGALESVLGVAAKPGQTPWQAFLQKQYTKHPRLQKQLQDYGDIAAGLYGLSQIGTTSSTEGLMGGAMSGVSAATGMAGAFGATGAALGPWAIAGAVLGGIFGFGRARHNAEEQARKQREQQLAELRKLNNTLKPVSDYFNRGAFGPLSQAFGFTGGLGLEQEWALAGARGTR